MRRSLWVVVALALMLPCVGGVALAGAVFLGPGPGLTANDTGGIIAYSAATEADARQIAVDHCASYGKVVKFLAVDAQYGGYISFACRWVPYGAHQLPVKALY